VDTGDLLVVSIGGTSGWRTATRELVASAQRVGAQVAMVATGPVAEVRTFALTDYVQARAASRAARSVLARGRFGAVIYCSITAALLWPTPGAIWVDALAAENRPGRHGIWQRRRERARLRQAPLVLGWSPRALGDRSGLDGQAVVLPVPVAPSGRAPEVRDIAAITYGANPTKKGLARILEAWTQARRDDERLVVAGVDGFSPVPAGVEVVGRLDPAAYRALVRRARVYIAAPVREEYGIAPLEALADGCQLVTTPAPGGYPALDIARALDDRLVGEDLVGAIRTALDSPRPDYRGRAASMLEAFSHAAMDRALAQDVLPRLLPAWVKR
jgi:hypothetical protein